MELPDVSDRLRDAVDRLRFGGSVAHVYNPLNYARGPHHEYLARFGAGRKAVLLVGMNPGPFGMAQTGVPFGDVAMVRDWLGVRGRVGRPRHEHPKRPVLGFDCPRREISGTRLWGWARDRFATPTNFFRRFFVWNYCPLMFLDEGGRNVTPDKIAVSARVRLDAVCDEALRSIVAALQPQWVVGVGAFAESSARRALDGRDVRIGRILHPSPASPIANRGWAKRAEAELAGLGVALP
ncbi:MAG: single-strand selective monofunctional uracil-DNA glycosylase [Phycisphaerales bacterium]|nr:MAG: single-strand selective monofunctional uracil-DNA glycosylase [Phycisphaerales bacterium]